MADIQRLKGSRAGYRAHVMHIFKKADDIMNTGEPLTPPEVNQYNGAINPEERHLKQLNGQILETIESPEDLKTEIVEVEEIEDSILEYMAVIESFIEPRRTTVESTPLSVTAPPFVPIPVLTDVRPSTEPVCRLPKLTFSGDPLTWQPFRDSFDS